MDIDKLIALRRLCRAWIWKNGELVPYIPRPKRISKPSEIPPKEVKKVEETKPAIPPPPKWWRGKEERKKKEEKKRPKPSAPEAIKRALAKAYFREFDQRMSYDNYGYRKCHDCGCRTIDYRCPECWRQYREDGIEESWSDLEAQSIGNISNTAKNRALALSIRRR